MASPNAGEAKMTKTGLTERQRYWLEHFRRCESQAMGLSDYARAHQLSVDAMYNAKSKLKLRGAYEAAHAVTQAPRFVRVDVAQGAAASRASSTACRVHFANGAMVELSVELSELASLFRSVVCAS